MSFKHVRFEMNDWNTFSMMQLHVASDCLANSPECTPPLAQSRLRISDNISSPKALSSVLCLHTDRCLMLLNQLDIWSDNHSRKQLLGYKEWKICPHQCVGTTESRRAFKWSLLEQHTNLWSLLIINVRWLWLSEKIFRLSSEKALLGQTSLLEWESKYFPRQPKQRSCDQSNAPRGKNFNLRKAWHSDCFTKTDYHLSIFIRCSRVEWQEQELKPLSHWVLAKVREC